MADRFWVGGSATWDATAGTKWATTTGGGGGAAVPTAADDVRFDGNSTGPNSDPRINAWTVSVLNPQPASISSRSIRRGVPASAVAPLVPGDNSRETVRSAVLQVGRGPRLLAVTSAYHARRVLDEARRQGLILGAACPSRSPDVTTPQIHRARVAVEVVGVLVYALPKPWALVLRSAFGRWRPALSRAVGGRRAWNEPAYPQ